MPELNNNFIKGRMNKDLDERLVANGEYRDALNIEVSTSEGSNVGTVQTVMGNTKTNTIDLGSGWTCVGSAPDEKNDTIYWFATSDDKDVINKQSYDDATGGYITTPVLVDKNKGDANKENVLNFDSTRLITGINILDDMLFWTDNHSEPKKINIPRCIEGTADINTHTNFIAKTDAGINITYQSSAPNPIEEKHITLIKKSPLATPHLFMSNKSIDRGIIFASIQSYKFTDNSGVNLTVGTEVDIPIGGTGITPGGVDYRIGDVILATDSTSPALDFTEHQVRLVLEEKHTGHWRFSIVSITNITLSATNDVWKLKLVQEDPLFEFKFPRFATRFRFQDGEYSPFSPWTKVAFLPGGFDYNPKKGYNLGMANQLRVLKIQDFVPEDSVRPDGVVAIDILYKESNSPNVYTLKTITTEDDEFQVNGSNSNASGVLTRGSIDVTSELIHAVVASNQTLRHWDNVPRKALSQDTTGNRIVFGNYLQNYNLTDSSNKNISIELHSFIDSVGISTVNETAVPSLKTLRTYQLGIVYRDKYGRETPVLASSQDGAGINLKKEFSNQQNQFRVKVHNNKPTWADSFKFFVKETSNEYYNLAMDRWYNAEDGNVWLSFPSAERNKVDEETYLILKKQHDNDKVVLSDARYKVIAIENEAPEFIKLRKKSYGTMVNNNDKTYFGDEHGGGYPERNVNFVYINKKALDGTQLKDADPALGPHPNDKKYIRFTTNSSKSDWYEILVMRETEIQNTGSADAYYIKVAKDFDRDMDFTTYNSTSQAWGTGAWADRIAGLKVEIAREIEDVKPEYRGRFFVKVFKDPNLIQNVLKPTGQELEYISVWSEPIYYLSNRNWQVPISWEEQVPSGSVSQSFWDSIWSMGGDWYGLITGPFVVGLITGDHYPTEIWWRNFGSHWFLDNCETRTHDTGNAVATLWNGNGDTHDMENYPHVGHNGHAAGGIGPGGGLIGNGFRKPRKKLHLAFSGCYQPGTSANPNGSPTPNHERGDYHNVDVGIDCNLDEKTWKDHITTPGTIFKWSLDPEGNMYIVESVKLYKSGETINDSTNDGNIKDELVNYDFKYRASGNDEYKHAANKRVRYEVTFGKYTAGGPLPNEPGYIEADGMPDPATGKYWPLSGGSMTVSGVSYSWNAANHHDSAHPIEILKLELDEEGDFSSTNPAIWETEPKEDIGLDLYYEASINNPITLNAVTNEVYAPVGSKLTLPKAAAAGTTGIRSWYTANNTYAAASSLEVTAFNDNVITINDQPYETATSASPSDYLKAGDKIIFTRPNGSKVTGTVAVNIVGATHNVPNSTYQNIPLREDLHQETYYLDWHNCFAFGNGVESNRIRDDFNAVTIDKGPKVSTTLAELYEEERKSNGLIYSGIYNSTSGINRTNEFIQAEKITKDLNPRFGSIQKLHTRDNNLIVFCEDKVVRVLANKDAIYNADGNAQLVASDRVLGDAAPFTGEWGISKNPESFAYRGYDAFFSDKARGAVLRLAQNGITPISDHGMKDWFNDNLKNADKIIGSYDEKKGLYNITLTEPNVESSQPVSVLSNSGFTPTQSNIIGTWVRYQFTSWAEWVETGGASGSTVIPSEGKHGGWAGIQAGSPTHPTGVEHGRPGMFGANANLTNPITLYFYRDTYDGGGNYPASADSTTNWDALIAALNVHGTNNVYLYQNFYHAYYPTTSNPWPPTNWNYTHNSETCYSVQSVTWNANPSVGEGYYTVVVNWLSGLSGYQDINTFSWSLKDPFDRTVIDSGGTSVPEYTLSFASKTNGWVSFKSWIQEAGLSVNGEFYTFKGANLWKHHSNSTRNNFYNFQYDSTVDVLLNEQPNSVKSFQTLKYSGSQAKISKNILTGINSDGFNQFDNQYYNNTSYDGWFANTVETDLQSGKDLEFKPKENKWFTTMQGLSTYFNSASDTNVDETEFSVQGIGYASGISITDDPGDPVDPPRATTFTLTVKDDPADH